MTSGSPHWPARLTPGSGLMVCGTTSDAGKTTLVAGLCRLFARSGVSVAPFKAQNMALNSAVTAAGHEIGRAQFLQAQAAGIPADVAMNPILLKPTSETGCQVIVGGHPATDMTAAEYHEHKPRLLALVLEHLADLRARFDVVLCEGAGSPTEINLLARDIVNLRVAERSDLPAVIVGNIDLGGVFAALHGTVDLLPDDLRRCVRGFVINRLRGDPDLLLDGCDLLEAASGVPTLGVLPMLRDLRLDAEDSLALDRLPLAAPDAALDVAVVRFPHISNFTDLDPLIAEPDVALRWVSRGRDLGAPDLVILPGTKATLADLDWMHTQGISAAISASEAIVLGICGGYQMLGGDIVDGVESPTTSAVGLGLLPVTTRFAEDKVLAHLDAIAGDETASGYLIHHGRVVPDADADDSEPDVWIRAAADGAPLGVRSGRIIGTSLHGLLDADGMRRRLLGEVAARAGVTMRWSPVSPADLRLRELDRLADAIEAHLDLDQLVEIMRPSPGPPHPSVARGLRP